MCAASSAGGGSVKKVGVKIFRCGENISHSSCSEKRRKKRAEEREREARGGSEGGKLLWSERDISPALTTSTRLAGAGEPHSVSSTLKMDPRLKEMLGTCATYNIDQGDDDDPLSEAVVEELRHADKMDIINERSLAASPLNSPPKSHIRTLGMLRLARCLSH